MERRSFLLSLGASLITAPAIIRPENIMKVKSFILGDGVALYSTSHSLYSWQYCVTDLTENSFLEAIIEIKKSFEPENFRRGLRIAASYSRLTFVGPNGY